MRKKKPVYAPGYYSAVILKHKVTMRGKKTFSCYECLKRAYKPDVLLTQHGLQLLFPALRLSDPKPACVLLMRPSWKKYCSPCKFRLGREACRNEIFTGSLIFQTSTLSVALTIYFHCFIWWSSYSLFISSWCYNMGEWLGDPDRQKLNCNLYFAPESVVLFAKARIFIHINHISY